MTIYLTEEMFATGQQPVAQGEVNIWMKKYAPADILERAAALRDLRPMSVDDTGRFILGHSESGHHHVLEAVRDVPASVAAQVLIDAANETFAVLKLAEECRLIHMKDHDRHDTYVFPAGEYIRGIREEQAPEGWRQVSD